MGSNLYEYGVPYIHPYVEDAMGSSLQTPGTIHPCVTFIHTARQGGIRMKVV